MKADGSGLVVEAMEEKDSSKEEGLGSERRKKQQIEAVQPKELQNFVRMN